MNFFKLKIKTQPEDFVVEEISDLAIHPQGPFAVYILHKQGWNTVDALRVIAKNLGLPSRLLAYGGKKDRYGSTRQMITIQEPIRRSVQEKKFHLEFKGFANQPMGPHSIRANRFSITVRRLTTAALERARLQMPSMQAYGYFNYFDDQRFGSYDFRQGFLGERIFKRQWNDALKTYLLSIHPEDKRPEKDRKRSLEPVWKDWESCLRLAETAFEKMCFSHLVQHPQDLLPMVQHIPREDLGMAISAYQSQLWNEWVRRLLCAKKLVPFTFYHGAAGDYLFYSELAVMDLTFLQALELPTLGPKMSKANDFCHGLLEEIMRDQGLQISWLNHQKLTAAHFGSALRPVRIIPEAFTFSESQDELYPDYLKLRLDFNLPRGAYATMLIKRLFAEPGKYCRYPLLPVSEP